MFNFYNILENDDDEDDDEIYYTCTCKGRWGILASDWTHYGIRELVHHFSSSFE